MGHPRKLEAMMLRSIRGTASLIIAVICISVFGNLRRIIRIRIMLRMFGKLSSAAPIKSWILPARPPLGGYWDSFCLHKSGTILLMLISVMVLVLPTWLLPVAVTISVLTSVTVSTSPSTLAYLTTHPSLLRAKKFVVAGLMLVNMLEGQ